MDSRFTNMEPRRGFVGHLWYPLRRIDISEIFIKNIEIKAIQFLFKFSSKPYPNLQFFSLQKDGAHNSHFYIDQFR